MNSKTRKILIFAQLVLMISGIFFMGKPAYHFCRWKFREIEGKILWEQWKNSGNSGKLEFTPEAWINIPDMGINSLVISGASRENLLKYPCFAAPDTDVETDGLRIILAHRDMHFKKLENIKPSNDIYMELKNRDRIKYTVLDIEILTPECASARLMEKKGENWLVLMTCYPFKYMGPAPKRFLVWAKESDVLEKKPPVPHDGVAYFMKKKK